MPFLLFFFLLWLLLLLLLFNLLCSASTPAFVMYFNHMCASVCVWVWVWVSMCECCTVSHGEQRMYSHLWVDSHWEMSCLCVCVCVICFGYLKMRKWFKNCLQFVVFERRMSSTCSTYNRSIDRFSVTFVIIIVLVVVIIIIIIIRIRIYVVTL